MSIPIGKRIKVGLFFFILIAITGSTYYWKKESNGQVIACTCYLPPGGGPVTWTSSPAGNESFCNSAWIISGQNPNQCQ